MKYKIKGECPEPEKEATLFLEIGVSGSARLISAVDGETRNLLELTAEGKMRRYGHVGLRQGYCLDSEGRIELEE